MIVSQVNTSLIRRILDKGNCQKELDHDNRASAPPFPFELSSLAFSQTALISSAFGFAARSSRVLTHRRSREWPFLY